MDESGPSFNAFKELCTMTDLALCTTKATAQATDKVVGLSRYHKMSYDTIPAEVSRYNVVC